jgi:hypothetical protein
MQSGAVQLMDYVQFTPRGPWRKSSVFAIRGDFPGGAPTIEILDLIIQLSPSVANECWQFSHHENFANARAFQIESSSSGEERNVRLLNSVDELIDPSSSPMLAALKIDVIARLRREICWTPCWRCGLVSRREIRWTPCWRCGLVFGGERSVAKAAWFPR